MLRQTLIAAATVSLMAFGATDAFAGKGSGRHGGGDHYGGRHYGGGNYRGSRYGAHHGHRWYRYPHWWLTHSYPRCHYEPRKVRIKVWDRHGRPYHKWVWRDGKVC
jgi:hypothetical protein